MEIDKIIDRERAKIGQVLGVSSWYKIDQAKIDAFANVTGDHQFIHVDPLAAIDGPFGGTIAHGYLTLSLTATMAPEVMPMQPGQKMYINYGFDKIRFLAPVPSNGRVRGRFTLAGVNKRAPGQLLYTLETLVEIEGFDTAAIAATWLTLAVFD
ncbi:MAG: MaoC family dehydratase [Alphaproteobacteria bacterium]